MTEKPTTGEVISRLGVLTVLTNNLLQENHVDSDTRRKLRREQTAIVNGMRGVSPNKVAERCLERCAASLWN